MTSDTRSSSPLPGHGYSKSRQSVCDLARVNRLLGVAKPSDRRDQAAVLRTEPYRRSGRVAIVAPLLSPSRTDLVVEAVLDR
jgi:hypothetical protein